MGKTRRKKGFTLIELILVVAIVMILTAVLLVGLNPVEQIRKSNDAGKIRKAKEAVQAAEAYYLVMGSNPTCGDLILTQELKTGACSGINLIVVSNGVYRATFEPESKTYKDICDSGEAPNPILCSVPDELL